MASVSPDHTHEPNAHPWKDHTHWMDEQNEVHQRRTGNAPALKRKQEMYRAHLQQSHRKEATTEATTEVQQARRENAMKILRDRAGNVRTPKQSEGE